MFLITFYIISLPRNFQTHNNPSPETNHHKILYLFRWALNEVPDRRNSFRITQAATDHCSRVHNHCHSLGVFNCSLSFSRRVCAVRARSCPARLLDCSHWSRRPHSKPFYTRESSAPAQTTLSRIRPIWRPFGFWNPLMTPFKSLRVWLMTAPSLWNNSVLVLANLVYEDVRVCCWCLKRMYDTFISLSCSRVSLFLVTKTWPIYTRHLVPLWILRSLIIF